MTLHNVEKFDQLIQVKKGKIGASGESRDEIEPSEDYMNNLRQSFNFKQVAQSLTLPGNNRATRNLRKEDNTILFSKMQN